MQSSDFRLRHADWNRLNPLDTRDEPEDARDALE